MMNEERCATVLGIDIGTTSTKVAAFDPERGVFWLGSRESHIVSQHPGWADGSPEQWWSNTVSLVQEYVSTHGGSVSAIAVTGMVPTLIALDEAGQPLTTSMQQNDARAVEEIAWVAEQLSQIDVLARTGSGVTQQSIAPKIEWLRRHDPAAFAATTHFVGAYDFIVRQLTDVIAVESNWALESGLWDLHSDSWDREILDACSISEKMLPQVIASGQIIGGLTSEVSTLTGLAENVPVVMGGADHVLSTLAAGAVTEGETVVKIGGAGDVLVVTSEPVVDERLFLDYHATPGQYLSNGCMATSGAAIRWFAEQFAEGCSLDELNAAVNQTPAGSSGVVFLPYLLGEKTPLHDPLARAAFVGMHLGTTRADLFRAVLEGVAYGVRHHLDIIQERGFSISVVRLTDGGARSALLGQILADILGREVRRLGEGHSSALGAALIAAHAVGIIDNYDSLAEAVETIEVHSPHRGGAYERGYAIYRALYPALKEIRAGGAL